MRARTTALLATTSASLLAIAVACSSSTTVRTSPPATGDGGGGPAPIIIGVSDSLTGGLGSFGPPLSNAIRVAEQQINAAGGVLGRQVTFTVLDDASDETSKPDDGGKVTGTVQSLLAAGAVAIIGPNGSGQVATVAPFLTAQRVVQISATATSVELTGDTLHLGTGADRYLFRTVPPDDYQGKAVVRFAMQGPQGLVDGGTTDDGGAVPGLACARMALFRYTNPYGTSMADVITKQIAGVPGASIVKDVSVTTTKKASYATEVAAIAAAQPDCLAMIVYADVGGVFASDLKAKLQSAPWNPSFFVIGTDGTYVQDFIDNARPSPGSPTAAEGVYGTNPDTNPEQRRAYQDFKRLYTAQFPLAAGQTDLPAYASNEFDAAMLVALGIAKAGAVDDPVKLRDAIVDVSGGNDTGNAAHGPADFVGALADIARGLPIDYDGASGPVDLQPDGNVLGGYIVWKVENGAFVTVERIPADALK